jgi:hypothetical protein
MWENLRDRLVTAMGPPIAATPSPNGPLDDADVMFSRRDGVGASEGPLVLSFRFVGSERHGEKLNFIHGNPTIALPFVDAPQTAGDDDVFSGISWDYSNPLPLGATIPFAKPRLVLVGFGIWSLVAQYEATAWSNPFSLSLRNVSKWWGIDPTMTLTWKTMSLVDPTRSGLSNEEIARRNGWAGEVGGDAGIPTWLHADAVSNDRRIIGRLKKADGYHDAVPLTNALVDAWMNRVCRGEEEGGS